MPILIGRLGKCYALTPTLGGSQGTKISGALESLQDNDRFSTDYLLSSIVLIYSQGRPDLRTPPIDLRPVTLTAAAQRYTLGKGNSFLTERRPEYRKLSDAIMNEIFKWIRESSITIGKMADTKERKEKAIRILYTWKDYFAIRVRDIKATNLIEYSIDLDTNSRPIKGTLPKYTAEEREFSNKIFPEMEDTGIVYRRSSPWGARTKFPPKKKGSPLKRVVHNFKPVNTRTIKSGYPIYSLKEVVNTLLKPKWTIYFYSDTSNGYWAVPMKVED